MADLFTTHIGVVYPWEHDQMGHMNVQHYVAKFDQSTWNIFGEAGLTIEYMLANAAGMAAVQQNITYRTEMTAGDRIEVRSGFLEVGERKVRFVHEMANRANGVVAAICEITGVSLNFETRRSQALPEEILDRARALVVDYDFAAVRPGG